MAKNPEIERYTEIVKGWFSNNIRIKVIALLIALTAWVWIAIGMNQKASISVPMRINYNLDKNLVMVGEVPEEITVTVWGPRETVRTLGASQIRLWVDIPNPLKGENRIVLGPNNILLPEKVVLIGMEPKVFLVEFVEKKNK